MIRRLYRRLRCLFGGHRWNAVTRWEGHVGVDTCIVCGRQERDERLLP